MPISLDLTRFEQGHELFLAHMLKKAGEPFANFNHPFFYEDEIRYKLKTIQRADDALQLEKWTQWRAEPGRIFAAVDEACSPRISANLLHHRHGRQKPFLKTERARRHYCLTRTQSFAYMLRQRG